MRLETHCSSVVDLERMSQLVKSYDLNDENDLPASNCVGPFKEELLALLDNRFTWHPLVRAFWKIPPGRCGTIRCENAAVLVHRPSHPDAARRNVNVISDEPEE